MSEYAIPTGLDADPSTLPPPKPSKTKRKAELDDLRRFGEDLAALPAGRLARLVLPDDLRRAIDTARRIPSNSARKRQLQTIGRLMEDIDAGAIRAHLTAMDHEVPLPAPPPAPREPSADEILAETLLDGGDAALFALSERIARDDLQTLRQAVRLARKQLDAGAARALAIKSVAACLGRFA